MKIVTTNKEGRRALRPWGPKPLPAIALKTVGRKGGTERELIAEGMRIQSEHTKLAEDVLWREVGNEQNSFDYRQPVAGTPGTSPIVKKYGDPQK